MKPTDGGAIVAIDGGDLPLGGGLLSLIRPALDLLAPGGLLSVRSEERTVALDMEAWCRAERHRLVRSEVLPDGATLLVLERGSFSRPRGERESGRVDLDAIGAQFTTTEFLRAVPMPKSADPASGFAPRGARVEAGGPIYPFSLLERDHVAPPEVAELYDLAVASQWDANRDIPWRTVRPFVPALEAALGQIMSVLAENELSALYLPARFLPRIHPAFVEVSMLLAIQMADEARHIDVFLKRARAGGGGPGVSSATTSASLHSLLMLEDFTEAEFLLSVLGEGTFLDLLKYIESYAPDEATFELVRRARADEARHVHFGLAHVRHALAHDGSLYARLEAAVRRRASTLAGAGGVPAPLQDALVILAAGGTDPRGVRRGHDAFRALLGEMDQGRRKRLRHAGFSEEQARTISELHTPNFM